MKIIEESALTKHLNIYGIREGDEFHIKPSYGRKKSVGIKFNHYDFMSENLKNSDNKISTFYLPSQKGESFHVELKQYQVFSKSEQRENNRFFVKVLLGSPVKLNGNYISEGIVEVGDNLEIGLNDINFKQRDLNSEDRFQHSILSNKKLINSNLPILIHGETGVGKTTLARKIHEQSQKNGRFIHLNISSFSENLVESELFGHVKGAFTGAIHDKRGAFRDATEGTLFLDEIDSLSFDLQTKLLLFLDDLKACAVGGSNPYQVNTRVLFSSGQNLDNLLKKGKMRQDFYYRISSGFSVKLPSLRNDTKLIKDFCLRFSEKHSIFLTNSLIDFYMTLPWPGNFRQLQGHLERKRVLAKSYKIDFDEDDEMLIAHSSSIEELIGEQEFSSLKELKYVYARTVFFKNGKNFNLSAKKLGISSRSLRNILQAEKI